MTKSAPKLDLVFHALGDATRRAILEMASERPVSISQLAGPLNITLAAVVQHVQVLEEAGLMRTEKVGRVRSCRIDPKGLAFARQWLDDRCSLWERRLDRLGRLFAEDDAGAQRRPRRPKHASPKGS
ncbi:MAG: helix-turn-helix transcriptional regulator [Alphaproteobacteria bacterium]|nr:helix-turn-helix transcriptional regulator [Alphaproteobacteria bacterium]MDE1987777.1 helix-turn-helix transcriptional regulator [Alphaproteobacteria bacterium]